MMRMYEYTDKIIAFINRQAVKKFRSLRSKNLAKIDEVTILGYVESLYSQLYDTTVRAYLKLANWSYFEYWFLYQQTYDKKSDIPKRERKSRENNYRLKDIEKYLGESSPVTQYIFNKECDRKRSRLFEAIVASEGEKKVIDTALRQWSKMTAEYAVQVTDKAVMDSYKANGIKKVVWFTEEDERVCGTCGALHGKVFNIDKVPPQPHWGCRCYLVPLTEKS